VPDKIGHLLAAEAKAAASGKVKTTEI